MLCPECMCELTKREVMGIAVSTCGTCAGVWVHPESLKELLIRDPEGLAALENQFVPDNVQQKMEYSEHNCPECGSGLHNYQYCYSSDIILQTCDACGGFWIEDGQLAQMQRWIDACHEPLSPEQQMKLDMENETIRHETIMERQNTIRHLFVSLRANRPGWGIWTGW